MFSRRPMIWFAVMLAAGILLARSAPNQAGTAAFLLALGGMAVVALCFLRPAPAPEAPGEEPAANETPVSSSIPGTDSLRQPEAPVDETETAAPLAPRPGLLVRLGRERIFLALGLFAAAGGSWRQLSVDHALARARQSLPPVFAAEIEILEPPEHGLSGKPKGYWNCPGRLLRITDQRGTAAGGASDKGHELVTKVAVLVAGYGPRTFGRGDRLTGLVRREQPRPAAFPGAFDRRNYLEARGLATQLRFFLPPGKRRQTSGIPDYTVTPASGPRLLSYFDRWRSAAVDNVRQRLPDQRGEFLAAAMFGYRISLDPELRADFRNVGIGHILAISGLHVGLIVGLAWWGLSFFIVDRRYLAALCIAVCLGYLALSGGRVAAVRASVMAVIYLAGFVFVRRSDFTNSLGAAALLLLGLNPAALTNLGFQLSFIAVLFISRLGAEINQWLESKPEAATRRQGLPAAPAWRTYGPRMLRALRGLAILSSTAWLGVWPLTAMAFHYIAPVGLFLNIVVVPLMSVVLAGGILLQLAGLLPPPLSAWYADLVAAPAGLLIRLADWFSRIPGGSIKVPAPPTWLVIVYFAAFALFLLRRRLSGNPQHHRAAGWFSAGLILATTAAMLLSMRPGAPPPRTLITLLPGRYGETAVIERASGETVVIGRLARGGLDVARFLHYRRRQRIDLVLDLTGKGKVRSLLALQDHMDVRKVMAVALRPPDVNAGQKFSPGIAATESWREIPGAPGLLAHFSWSGPQRKRKASAPLKKLVWWALADGKLAAGLSEWSWKNQVAYRFRKRAPGTDAPLILLRIKGGEKERAFAETLTAAWIFLGHDRTAGSRGQDRGQGRGRGRGRYARDQYGAIQLTTDAAGRLVLRAYDGREWRRLARRE